MLQFQNPIDELLDLPDLELKGALNKGEYPLWIHDYVDFVLSGGFPDEDFKPIVYH